MQMKSDEARKDLRWWASLLLTTLAPENGLNRMNGFNVSCLPPPSPLLCCLLEVLTVFTKPTNPPGGLCPLFVQCFVQDCPFVPTTGHKNSVSSSDCGREAAVCWLLCLFYSAPGAFSHTWRVWVVGSHFHPPTAGSIHSKLGCFASWQIGK